VSQKRHPFYDNNNFVDPKRIWLAEILKMRRHLMAANCASRVIRAKKSVASAPIAGCGLHFRHNRKIFTISAPVNLQNNRVYVPATTTM